MRKDYTLPHIKVRHRQYPREHFQLGTGGPCRELLGMIGDVFRDITLLHVRPIFPGIVASANADAARRE
jgi:hypothetical protein